MGGGSSPSFLLSLLAAATVSAWMLLEGLPQEGYVEEGAGEGGGRRLMSLVAADTGDREPATLTAIEGCRMWDLAGGEGAGVHNILAGCQDGDTIVLTGKALRRDTVEVQLAFMPYGTTSHGPQPHCDSLVVRDATTANCTLSIPGPTSGLWALHWVDTSNGRSSVLGLPEGASRPFLVEITSGATVGGLAGCGPKGCESGALLTVFGASFDTEHPLKNSVQFLPLPKSVRPRGQGNPPSCRVLDAPNRESVRCILIVPKGAEGMWGVSTSIFAHSSPLWVELLPGLGMSIKSVGGCPNSLCKDKDIITILGNQFRKDTRITFRPAGQVALPQPGCSLQWYDSPNMIRCLITSAGGEVNVPWQVALEQGSTAVASTVVISFGEVKTPYDALKWPYPDGFGEDRSIPLADQWKMYENVSIVWSWVNGSDPNLRASRVKHGGAGQAETSQSRENNELLYSFRSYWKYFADWHKGPIFIVSPGQTPTWLNTSHPRVNVIDQADLIPDKSKNPVFNSNNIEPYLYRIPGLTKYLIYLNDDYFFYQKTHPADFFLPNGGIQAFQGPGVMNYPKTGWEPAKSAWKAMSLHSWDISDRTYGDAPNYYLKHSPFVFARETLRGTYEKFESDFKNTLNHKFRKYDDVILPILHYQYAINEGHRHGIRVALLKDPDLRNKCWFIGVRNNVKKDMIDFNNLKNDRPMFYNLNDLFSKAYLGWLIRWYIGDAYPEPSPFEKEGFEPDLYRPDAKLIEELRAIPSVPRVQEVLGFIAAHFPEMAQPKKSKSGLRSVLRGQ